MSGLVRLYPRTWRARYEVEFLGVLASRPPSLRDRFDIVRGAMDARLHPELQGSPGGPRSAMQPARLAAAVSCMAGVAWLVWIGLLLGNFRGWGAGMPENAELIFGLQIVTFLALAAAHLLLAYVAQGTIRSIGSIGASVAAMSFAVGALGGGMLLAFALIGSAGLAAGLAGRIIPRWASVAWVVTSVAVLAAMGAFVAGGGRDVGLLVIAAPFGLTWILVGLVLASRGVPSPAREASNSA